MSPHVIFHTRQHSKLIAQITLLAFFLVLLCGVGSVLSIAQDQAGEEREIENTIPKHLPIKVTMKNLEKVKDLKNDNWARDVEIEVMNTGTKPIYYLRLTLYFVDIKLDTGYEVGWPLRYGRPELVDFDNHATPEDVPIQPGEIYTFKVPAGMVTGWEKYKANHKVPHPKKIGLQFELLNYGDGTGFVDTGGEPIPNRQSSNSHCGNQKSVGTIQKAEANISPPRPPNDRSEFLSLLPARFLPVNFLAANTTEPTPNAPPPQSGLCCPSSSCFSSR